VKAGGKQSFSMLVSSLAYSLTLKMEVTFSSEISADYQWTTQRYIPENRTLLNGRTGLKIVIAHFGLAAIYINFLCGVE
jgi:hypothetical protein